MGHESKKRIRRSDVATKLQKMYPTMFKPSQRCRSPHINIDNLRDCIFTAGVIEKNMLKNSADLLDWILMKNRDLSQFYRKKKSEEEPSSAAVEKALKFDFYLGLNNSWLYK